MLRAAKQIFDYVKIFNLKNGLANKTQPGKVFIFQSDQKIILTNRNIHRYINVYLKSLPIFLQWRACVKRLHMQRRIVTYRLLLDL